MENNLLLTSEENNIISPKSNKQKEYKEVIWSVSLIPFNHMFGYLIGEELRWKEDEIKFHLVGGKVESFDKDPLSAAVREFIEETNLLLIPFIKNKSFENFQKWTNENDIHLNTTYPSFTTFIQNEFEENIRDLITFQDILVSPHGKIHRFYFFDVLKIKNKQWKDLFLYLPIHYTHFEPELRINGKMWSLHWIHSFLIRQLPNKSILFLKFLQALDNQKKNHIQNKKNNVIKNKIIKNNKKIKNDENYENDENYSEDENIIEDEDDLFEKLIIDNIENP